ncbi:hypothetical protein [Nakamurella multipartita]|uniref:Uncharacterized protein n=1 Tax=Nakamurella multipartita (strain ATCC 700099 / DSM 44233 / CIP 104796 / JCM 9543 / NBRC 105858 / Y-104) TaxID=479431 RepID=C8XCB1_NAKMY|nr:hypothetical protein [Nakamurella multipartita]ACV81505.1 hypothetical protein Namu_5239 [Nakamurella multipartita DSM 44233]
MDLPVDYRPTTKGSMPDRRAVVTIEFEIRVAGEVPAQVLADLQDARFVHRGVETVLHGPVEDQAALIGIINWLQMLGVELREVREVSPAASDPGIDPSVGRQ